MPGIYFDYDVGYDENLKSVKTVTVERTRYTEPHLAVGIDRGVVKMKVGIGTAIQRHLCGKWDNKT
jgi:hypothetical protein